MTAKEYMESFAENNGLWDTEKACQAYVIALGVNDIYGCHMPIGTKADVDVEDYRNNRPTFLGYYAAIVNRYKEISPDAKFFFVTFPKESPSREPEQTLGMIDALYTLTALFDNSYVINLYEYGPVYDEAFRKKFYLYGHLSPSGYLLTARIVEAYIDYLIRHNPEDFKHVGFIGTDIPYK